MKRRKIVIVGGGSNSWTPALVKDMLLTESIRDSEFVLLDIVPGAAERARDFLVELNLRHLHAPALITATGDRSAALRHADFIIITISTGGLDAMAHDLAIPEHYGIYHTVGDTSGPGGWARLLRNFEVFRGLASDFNRLAPDAVVMNYTNPMTTLTAVLCRLCEAPVVGLCHGLFENLEFMKKVYRLKDESELAVQYAGVNHFFWITAARAGRRDLLADLRRQLRTRTITDLWRDSLPDPMGFTSHRELATELFRTTGYMPYIGDRHTSEFLPGTITSRRNLKAYRLVRTSIETRRRGFRQRAAHLRAMTRQLRAAPAGAPAAGDISGYLERSRETAADIIAAYATGQPFIDVGNLPNIGQIDNLPRGSVVETAVRVDRNGFTPLTFGPLPEPLRSLVAPWPAVFDLTVEACFQRSRNLALQALRLDPTCAHLNTREVHEMGQRLMRAHARYLPAFK